MRKSLLLLALGVAIFATPAIAKDNQASWSLLSKREKEQHASLVLYNVLSSVDGKTAARMRACTRALNAEDLAMLVDAGYSAKENRQEEPTVALSFGLGLLVKSGREAGQKGPCFE